MLHALFWVITRYLNFICRHFRTFCLFHLHRWVGMTNSSYLPTYEDGTVCSETLAYKIQTSGNYQEESIQHKTVFKYSCQWHISLLVYLQYSTFHCNLFVYHGVHVAHLWQQCHKSKCVIFQERLLKILKCYNFIRVQRWHNCSLAASFANCVMTLYLLKVHLKTFLSIPITQKCQILSCGTLVANERFAISVS